MKDVRRTAGDNRMDKMESFWLAETLKYFYLLQEDDERPVAAPGPVRSTRRRRP